MIARRHPVHYSFREYVQLEDASNVKHEYLDGQIYAVAGGTPEHAMLIASVSAELARQVHGTPCRVSVTELRIRAPESRLGTYPDVPVICGPWARDPEDPRTILNPTIIVEVLSPTTEEYDRGEKFELYQTTATLQAYVLVAHDDRWIEVRTRGASGWAVRVHHPGEHAELPAIGAALNVAAIYAAAAEPPPS